MGLLARLDALTHVTRAVTGAGYSGPSAGWLTQPGNRRQREMHPFVGKVNSDRVHNAIILALSGNPSTLQDIFDDARDRDSRLDAVCRTRVLAVQGKPFAVRPAEGWERDPVALDHAKQVTAGIRAIPGWRTHVGELAGAVLNGHSLLETEWGVTRVGLHMPKALHWIHPNRMRFDDALSPEITDAGVGTTRGKPLADFGPDKFIFHSPNAGRAAYIVRRGVLLNCLFPALTKKYGVMWWMKAAERFGQPALYATVPNGASADLQSKAKEMLRQLTADWQGVVSAGIGIEAVKGSLGEYNGQLHREMVQWVDTSYAISILGQNLTTEVQGGSFAAVKGQEFVRQDILTADVAELDDTLTTQLVEPINRYNWPGGPPLVYETEVVSRSTKEIFAYHLQAGIVTVDEARESIGLQALPDGKGAMMIAPTVQGGVAPAPPTGIPAPIALGPGGSSAENPFPPGTPRHMEWAAEMTARYATTPTSTLSTHPLAQALRRSSDGRAS